MENTSEQLSEISKKLDQLIGILLVHGKPQDEQLDILWRRNLDNETIASIIGLSENAIAIRKHRKAKSKK